MPRIGPDDGLLRVEACGLCGTDHEQYSGLVRSRGAFIPGHEVVGVVEAIGAESATRWGVEPGSRVAVEVFKSCGDCNACRAGVYRRCARNGTDTMVGFIGVDVPPGLGGGYATHLYLPPDTMLLPVPDDMDPVFATLFNPLGAGIRWGVELPETSPGDVVAILGPGVRGLCAAAAAKEAGAEFVMITGLGPRDAERLAIAPRFGADLAVDVAQTDPNDALRRAVGRKADVVVDVTAKAPTAFGQDGLLGKERRHRGARRVARLAGDAGPRAGSDRLQRTAHLWVPWASTWPPTEKPSTCWPQAAFRSRTCPGKWRGSTTSSLCCRSWRASGRACRRCMACSRRTPPRALRPSGPRQ